MKVTAVQTLQIVCPSERILRKKTNTTLQTRLIWMHELFSTARTVEETSCRRKKDFKWAPLTIYVLRPSPKLTSLSQPITAGEAAKKSSTPNEF